MRVIRADALGFCAGVKRTVDLALEAAQTAAQTTTLPAERETASRLSVRTRLFTMGPLIHNSRALRDLERLGFSVLDEYHLPETLSGSVTVIRAHGIGPQTERELLGRGTKIIDATCPKVRKSQLKARELREKGYAVFIAGEKNHGEVRGIRMFAPDSLVVEDETEAFNAANALFLKNKTVKTAIIGQTTISEREYTAIYSAVKRIFPNLEVYNTICGATKSRQDALSELCAKTDALIIAGDTASSNTRRLLAIAEKSGKPAWIACGAADLPPEIKNYGSIGLSAGTSTPDNVIGEIEAALLE
ncbi:MAG: 4-hydroxy-3-methylbut-2-enyl diphosphate reductase [Treponema sp.]|jgi:4-hydroxy-3-methylbut-2-enyl diphosphate reductase|nr:4-hydroxy-3-methylbut-2-enyl diphosphate reductase [Treponema sp.]